MFPRQTMAFSRIFGLVDNIFELIKILASFSFCFLTYDLLERISFPEYPVDYKYLIFKRLLLIFMFIQGSSYLFNFCIISIYNPIIYTEKVLISIMILIININSIFFSIMQVSFIFTLKYDLYYVNLHLEIRPDLENVMEYEEGSLNFNNQKFLDF